METLIFQFHKLITSGEEHSDDETLRSAMGIAKLQPFRTLEGSLNTVGNITIGISVPGRSPLFIVIAQILQLTDAVAIYQQFKRQGELTVGIVLILGGVLILTLELDGTHRIAVAYGTSHVRALSLHSVLLFQLLDNIGRKFRIIIIFLPKTLYFKSLTRFQITVSGDDHTPLVFGLVFRIDILETGTERRNLFTTVNLTNARRVTIGILQHLIHKPHLHNPIGCEQIGILGSITTEHLLLFPNTTPHIEVLRVIFGFLRFLDVCPIKHVHVFPIPTDEEHR